MFQLAPKPAIIAYYMLAVFFYHKLLTIKILSKWKMNILCIQKFPK